MANASFVPRRLSCLQNLRTQESTSIIRFTGVSRFIYGRTAQKSRTPSGSSMPVTAQVYRKRREPPCHVPYRRTAGHSSTQRGKRARSCFSGSYPRSPMTKVRSDAGGAGTEADPGRAVRHGRGPGTIRSCLRTCLSVRLLSSTTRRRPRCTTRRYSTPRSTSWLTSMKRSVGVVHCS